MPVGFLLNDVQYYYVADLSGNVKGITDANGELVVSYEYDEWGKLIALTPAEDGNEEQIAVATKNPLRYRGYYYDNETGLYYLQSRYYSPDLCRFISPDDFDMSSVYNSNLFNYCGNDPVNNITKTGFNAPDQVISDSFVPQLVNSTNNLIKENRSTAKYFGEISTGLDTLSLGLRTTLDADAKSYWDETLNKQKDVVDNGYGFNYIQSAIDKNTSSVTKYSVSEANTPYKVSESID